jgi:diamine N-acetyltransferase
MQVFLDTYATQGIRPAIAREVVGTYSELAFLKHFEDQNSCIVVAERESHLVGFAQISINATHRLAHAGEQAELLRLYVQEPFTGCGVGSLLLRESEQIAVRAGRTVLWLTPWAHNHRALVFYSKRGYRDLGLTHFEFEGESHENRVFSKPLGP